MAPTRRGQQGFTLIEAIIVIMLTGIVGAMVAVFIKTPVNAYIDQGRRGELTDAADVALRRMARDLQSALPNSVRVNAAGTYIEFLPVTAAGRYRAAPSAAGAGNPLDFSSATDASFDVLGPPVDVVAGDQLVIYNLGITGADAYTGTSRRALTSAGNGLTSLSYTVGARQFPYASPNNRFYIVRRPVTYACRPAAGGLGTLRRYSGYAIQAAQPVSVTAPANATNALLTSLVSACSFAYTPTSARNAVVTLRLTLTSGRGSGGGGTGSGSESITLLHQVHVEASP